MSTKKSLRGTIVAPCLNKLRYGLTPPERIFLPKLQAVKSFIRDKYIFPCSKESFFWAIVLSALLFGSLPLYTLPKNSSEATVPLLLCLSKKSTGQHSVTTEGQADKVF